MKTHEMGECGKEWTNAARITESRATLETSAAADLLSTRIGKLFNIQRFSVHDGPGIRTTVFLKGCPLSCAWCHNPESRSPRTEFVRLANRCIRCGRCTDDELADPVVRDRGADDVEACPSGALQMVGEEWSVARIVDEASRDRVFYDQTGGGVTFSGGEPLVQAAFVTEAMQSLRTAGIHTALDTCGFARWSDLSAAAAHADLILYDLKLIDDARHKAATGVSNATILRNLVALSEAHRSIRIRFPVIPGFNDDDENVHATAAFVASLPGIQQVDLLPYHPTGASKFPRLGLSYPLQDVTVPSSDRMRETAASFRRLDVPVTIGGTA